jgi:lipopolysaccharide export system permease protein
LIVERYIAREVMLTFLGVALLLFLIFLSGSFIKILAEAAEGDLPAKSLFAIFALRSIGNLVLILPLSLFLGALLAMGRLNNDSETTAMLACGIGTPYMLRALGRVAITVAMFVMVLILFISPWAENLAQQMIDEAAAENDIATIEAGKFHKMDSSGSLIYLGERNDEDDTIRTIFTYNKTDANMELITAIDAEERPGPDGKNRYLVLKNGKRYQGETGSQEYEISSFGEYGVQIEDKEVVTSKMRDNAIPTSQLLKLQNNDDISELQWRISLPLIVIVLSLLAIPLSKTSPRQGKYGKVFAGILIYLIYNNLLTVSRVAIEKGELNPWIGVWWVHLLVVVISIVLILKQNNAYQIWRYSRLAT